MHYGAHLPLIAFDGRPRTVSDMCAYAHRAAALDFRYLCANDHLVYARPWLDGPTVLAAALEAAGDMTIATTVALPVIRGPVQTAKMLATLDILSGGRLIAGVGPGSSARDYAAAGLDFSERWRRFDAAIRALRALLGRDAEGVSGAFYPAGSIPLEPRPTSPDGPPLWIASWGSATGLRRVAELGDGWLASGYNTTPPRFRDKLATLSEQLRAAGRPPDAFPNGIATMWLYVTDTRREADRMLRDVLAPLLNRSIDELRGLALLIGSPEQCAERISAYAASGAQRMFVWPLADDLAQLEAFRHDVIPLVTG
jgi:alkanesulfonate monooxygenase SsuD/methylene tetrahydromethanopterin reductase-like flavin-dependent oxidoreductase (luciferase family)